MKRPSRPVFSPPIEPSQFRELSPAKDRSPVAVVQRETESQRISDR